MNKPKFIITALALTCLGIYLFVSAPPPLQDDVSAGAKIPVEKMFEILNAENAAVRAKWTQTVADGKKAGLQFNEHWRDEGVDAGPLPALFLRETAKEFVKSPTLLRLFLGSDFPIVASNLLEGVQAEKLAAIRKDPKPQYFYNESTKLYMAMFADYAVSMGCVDCHNQHPNSPKTDWHLNDIMGATTWSYPKKFVTAEEIIKNVGYLRNGFKAAYGAYLKKIETFKVKPELGGKWPGEGLFMPTLDVFVKEYEAKNSAPTMAEISRLLNEPAQGSKKEEVKL
jgi:adenylate cyclase